jgi:hypothetical protein
MRGEGLYVDVPADLISIECRYGSRVRLCLGQVVEGGIGGGITCGGDLDGRQQRVRNGGECGDDRGRGNCGRAPGEGQEIGPEDKPTLHACQGLSAEDKYPPAVSHKTGRTMQNATHA